MLTAAKEEQSVPFLAASWLSQNSHQDRQHLKQQLHRVIALANSLHASGLAASLYDDGRRSRSTAKERDAESGLDYFGARYYGSALGRFTRPDEPFVDQQAQDPQSWNLYAYVRNNPLKNTDPSGLDCITTSQSSNGLTVTTERGGTADSCSGTFVDGTVNVNSYSYNGSSLSYSDSSANSGGAINFVSGAQPDDVLSPDVANMLHNAGTQASQGTIAFVGAEALFATSYGATYALPALYSALAVGGEAGALYIGRGIQLTRDATGKVHGDLPKFVPQGASREQLKEAAQELQKSIEVRAQELIRLGEEGAHRARIEQERGLLRQIEKKLGGS